MSAETQFPPHVSADRPAARPEDDLFGYAPFAKHLADSICSLRAPDGLVIAVHGPWGSGKTTLLNFVLHYVKQRPESEQPIVVPFNPWWFAGEESLARAFLGQLQAVLPDKLRKLRNLSRLIGDFSDSIAGVAELVGYGPVGKVLKLFKGKPKDVPALKKGIADALAEAGKRIVIVIDDIDRLTAEEVRQLFKVVKAIADFPNVVYVLAFDKEAAAKALETVSGASGTEYLEKIVQAPFELPAVDKTSLRSALFKQLDQVLEGTQSARFDQTYWGNVYYEGIDLLIEVPRDIVRLVNTLRVTYPAVNGEVNPVDFIAIEAVRVFLPAVYTTVRSNAENFVGHGGGFDQGEKQSLLSFHQRWLTEVPENCRHGVDRMMRRLFPKLDSVLGNTTHGADWEPGWRRDLRICSADIFPIYLRLAVPEGTIGNLEMEALLEEAADPRELTRALLAASEKTRADGTSKARALLDRLADYVESGITAENIPVYVNVLLKIGDKLLLAQDEHRGFGDFGNVGRITRIVYDLLKRVEEQPRYELLKKGIEEGDALRVDCFLLGAYEEQLTKSKAGGETAMLSEAHVTELKETFLTAVRRAAESPAFLQRKEIATILHCWSTWGAADEVRQWAAEVTASDEGLAEFVAQFTQRGISQILGDAVGREQVRLNPKWLERFLDINATAKRVQMLAARKDLMALQKVALARFLYEFNLLQQGKNPDLPQFQDS